MSIRPSVRLDEHMGESAAPVAVSLAELPTVCLVVLTVCVVIYGLAWLESLLVPLTLAVFLSMLFEPILSFVSRLPTNLCGLCRRWCRHRRAREEEQSENDEQGVTNFTELSLGQMGATVQATHGLLDSITSMPTDPQGRACRIIQDWAQGTWDVFAVILCVLLLAGVVFGFVYGVIQAIEQAHLSDYKNSPKINDIINWLEKLGINFKSINWEYVWDNFKGTLFDSVTTVLTFTEQLVLTLLMFFFCLYATVQSITHRGRRGAMKVGRLVQQYLLMKTLSSAVIGGIVFVALKMLNVDLALLFGLLTFVLNFIPNLGSAIAMCAPLPLVLLDPTTTLDQAVSRVVIVLVVQFAIHNTLGCVLEPKLMSHGLDLHPLTVVVALTFWAFVWGIPGAVLSVPLTSVIKLLLEEFEHPYCQFIVRLLNGPKRKARPPATGPPPCHTNSIASEAVQRQDLRGSNSSVPEEATGP